MHRPVLVTPPAILPVSLAEARLHLRVDEDADDTLITSLIGAAVDHLDGWTGILGQCLVEQEWRQDFDAFASCLSLPLGPVTSITSVDYT
uniref:head-tail connector protein n=1 Tax=Hoeflea sp. TaxID=1940281 RepID=UPI002AFFC390